MYTKFFPNRLDGFPFALRDLIAVCTWAETKSVRMHVTWHTHINGVIEIFPWEFAMAALVHVAIPGRTPAT